MHLDIEKVYTLILVGVFLLIGWFSVYVVYKLFHGQR
jgi:cell division protein FtsL